MNMITMKKVSSLLLTASSLLFAIPAFAADTVIGISPPPQAISGDVSMILNNILKIIFAIAALLVLFFLIIGAFQWIVSGGDKDAVGKARSRITHALIGLAILALSFVIITLIGNILGVNLLNFTLPKIGA